MHIFVDWGSTNFRAFLMNEGRIAESCQAGGYGVLTSTLSQTTDRVRQYASFLYGQIGPWISAHPTAKIIMCGAIGSREGWLNTGYIEAPADFQKLGESLRLLTESERDVFTDNPLYILPGLAVAYPNGRHDVMRSEEIKSLGALNHLGMDDALLCIPGTHCKWVGVRGKHVTDFHSIMTGEIYGILSSAGSLGPIFQTSPEHDVVDIASFERGLNLAQEGNDLLSDIWQVRAQTLRSQNPPHYLKNYFSGILIGHEILQMQKTYAGNTDIVLLSDSGPRKDLYHYALRYFEFKILAEVESETAVCTGLNNIMPYLPS